MNTSWSDTPQLGLSPHFHADPTPGGPPMHTADGHWRWNGTEWVLVDRAALDDQAA